jgi:hypothetical protein
MTDSSKIGERRRPKEKPMTTLTSHVSMPALARDLQDLGSTFLNQGQWEEAVTE